MRLIPYDLQKIQKNAYKKSDNLLLLEEFRDSGMKCAKVEGFTQKTAGYCATSLNASIKRYKMFNIRAMTRKGKVYLVREN